MVQFFEPSRNRRSLGEALGQGLGQGLQANLNQRLQEQQQQKQQSLLNNALTEAEKIYSNPNLTPQQKEIGLIKALSSSPELGIALSKQLQGQQTAQVNREKENQSLENTQSEVYRLYKDSGLSDEEARARINDSVATARAYYANANKPQKAPPVSEFDKSLARKNAAEFEKNQEYISKSTGQLKALDDIDKLVNELSGPSGFLKLIPGMSEKPTELENLSFASVEPILKIFNPTGQIAVTKMNRILDQYAVSKWDSKATALGKTKALRSLLNQGLERAKQRNALIQKYNGNPPIEDLQKFDNESEQLLDIIAEEQKPKEPPKRADGKIRVKSKSNPQQTGWITPDKGWEEKYEPI